MSEHKVVYEEIQFEHESPIVLMQSADMQKSLRVKTNCREKTVVFVVESKIKNKKVILEETEFMVAVEAYNHAFERM